MEKFTGKSRADLHVHSCYSYDSFSPLESILKKAKERELDIIAITDHNTIEGALKAQKIAPEFKIEVIIGEEIDTKEGDIIGLFVKETIKPGKSALETVREIRRQKGLAIAPHPDNWFLGGVSAKNLFKIYNELDGIELLNGSWVGIIGRKKNKKMNKSIFNLASVSGSDAHLVRQVGCAYTFFPGRSKIDLYRAIKEKTTSSGGTVWNYKDRLVWLMNSPRIFCKNPQTPTKFVQRLFKKFLFRTY